MTTNRTQGIAGVAMMGCMLLSSANAQVLRDDDRPEIEPPEVPQLVPEQPEQVTVPDDIDPEAILLPQPGEAIILDNLVAVRLRADAAEVTPNGAQAMYAIDARDVPVLADPNVDYIARQVVGNPVSRESLDRLTQTIRVLLANLEKPFSVVYAPPQDITNGVIQLVVQESVVGAVVVEGNSHFSDEQFARWVRANTGEPLRISQIKEDVDWVSRNPFRSAGIAVRRGAAPGTTDLVIQARDRRTWRANIGSNNTGTKTTGEERYFLGLNHGNLWGLGHQAGLQFTADSEFARSLSLSGNYSVDLPWRHRVTIFAAASETEADIPPPLQQDGEGFQAGLNYDIPLGSELAWLNHSLQLGFDYKKNDNSLELALGVINIPLVASETEVLQWRLAYLPVFADPWGSTRLGAKLTYSPGDLASDNDDEAFQQSRAFAEADYSYVNFDLYRNTRLPGFLTGWEWNVRTEAQLASDNLVGSEQFSAGGVNSVRGYEEGEAFGDNAILASQELFTPFHRRGQHAGRAFVFQDYARVTSENKLPGEQANNLHSLGLGLRYQFSNYLTVQLSHGWQLRDSESSSSGDHSRFHFNLAAGY